MPSRLQRLAAHDALEPKQRGYASNGLKMTGVVDGIPLHLRWYFDESETDLSPMGRHRTEICVPVGPDLPEGFAILESTWSRQLATKVGFRSISLKNIPTLDDDYIVQGKSPRDVQEWASRPEIEAVLTEMFSTEDDDWIEFDQSELHIHFCRRFLEPDRLDEALAQMSRYARTLGGKPGYFTADWAPKLEPRIF